MSGKKYIVALFDGEDCLFTHELEPATFREGKKVGWGMRPVWRLEGLDYTAYLNLVPKTVAKKAQAAAQPDLPAMIAAAVAEALKMSHSGPSTAIKPVQKAKTKTLPATLTGGADLPNSFGIQS